MAIWRTSPPNPSDFPIWAYTLQETGTLDELKLYKSLDDLMLGDGMIIWTSVGNQVPVDVVPTDIAGAFQQLANGDDTVGWSSSDWFIAGYNYALSLKEDDTGECGCGQGKCGCSGE